MDEPLAIDHAELILPCESLGETLRFFGERLGMRLLEIFPADDPAEALLDGHGLRIRLRRGAGGPPGRLRVVVRGPDGGPDGRELVARGPDGRELVAPNGTVIEIVDGSADAELPPLQASFVHVRKAEGQWGEGRAGMHYRDLIPGHWGGRYVASHILIPTGGPVPDYVHYHLVRVQLIYCYRGWVRVVYEDQGPPFVLEPGDCVLQAPGIRHRVLESSAGLEVVEFSCPAIHPTRVDHELELPNAVVDHTRAYGGQRFVRHQLATARWRAWAPGFEARELGVAEATAGLADVQVVRAQAGASLSLSHEHELRFVFVLDGQARLHGGADTGDGAGQGTRTGLMAGDALAIPCGHAAAISEASADLQLLWLTIPAL